MIKKLLIVTVLCLVAVGWVHLMAQDIDWLGNKQDGPPRSRLTGWTDDGQVKAEFTSLQRTGFHLSATVKVSDTDNKVIGDLAQTDFEVAEDGEPVALSRFVSAGQAPLRVCLCIDYSNSMGNPPNHPKIEGAKKAALALLDLLRDHTDHLGLYFFNGPLRKQMERLPLAVLDADHRKKALEILEAINKKSLGGGTPMYAAMEQAVEKMKGVTGRRVLIVLTDGMDTQARTEAAKGKRIKGLGDASRENGIPIYMVSVAPGRVDKEGMQRMADAGGGQYFHAPKGDQLKGIFVRIGETLHNEYVLEWDSPNPFEDGSRRKVVITTRRGSSGTQADKTYDVPGVIADAGQRALDQLVSVFWPLGTGLALAFVVPYFVWLRSGNRGASSEREPRKA